MGMFSEIHDQSEADSLEKVLLVAIKENNKDVMAFCKEHILPLYKSVSNTVSENYRNIISVFNNIY